MLSNGAIEKKRGGPAGEAFETAIQPLRNDLARYCRSVTGNRWDADDLLQEAITKAYVRYVHTGQAEFKKAYLYRIASNAWIDRIRKTRELPMSAEWPRWDAQQQREQPLEDWINARWAVERIVRWLSGKQRTALILTEALELPLAEAARHMGVAEGAVKSLLRRGRDRLARYQDRDDEDQAVNEAVIEAYLRAIRSGDVKTIVKLSGVTATATATNIAATTAAAASSSMESAPVRHQTCAGFAAGPDGTVTLALQSCSGGGRSVVRILSARAGDAIAV